jgi:hypothetical protein
MSADKSKNVVSSSATASAAASATSNASGEQGPAARFAHRGLSDRTIQALLTFGMEFPEQLLSMMESDVSGIPAIGKAAMDEIGQYRRRFAARDTADNPTETTTIPVEDLNASNDD